MKNYRRKKYLLRVVFKTDMELNDLFVYKLMIILSKFFDAKVSSAVDDYSTSLSWKSYLLDNSSFYVPTDNHFFSFHVTSIFKLENEGVLRDEVVLDAISIYGGKRDDYLELSIEIYADLFTDIRIESIYHESKGWTELKIDNSNAAAENRLKLRSFIVDLKKHLNLQFIECQSEHFKENDISEFGFSNSVQYPTI